MGLFSKTPPGTLGEGVTIKTKLDLGEAREATAAVADRLRGREYPLLPRLVPAPFEWLGRKDAPASVDCFQSPDIESDYLFAAYWPAARPGDTLKMVAFVARGFGDPVLMNEGRDQWTANHWTKYDKSFKTGRSGVHYQDLRITTPQVPKTIIEDSLAAAGIPNEPKYWAHAARSFMIGYNIRMSEVVDNMAKAGKIPLNSGDQFREACTVNDADIPGSYQNVFDQFLHHCPNLAHLAMDFPWRIPAVMLLDGADSFMQNTPEIGANNG